MPGVRQRLGKALPVDEIRRPAAASAPGSSGGVRQRLQERDARASSSPLGPSSSAGPPQRGVRRRLERLDRDQAGEDEGADADKPFSKFLRRKWASGRWSAVEVLEAAETASLQGAHHLGDLSSGDPRNAHRKVMAHLGSPSLAPDIEWIEIPVEGRMVPHPIICPISLVENLLAKDPARFKKTIEGPDNDVASYWKGLCPAIVYQKNKSLIDTRRTIPCGAHGDGAPTTKVDGLFSISWNSLLGQGSTEETRQVLTVVKESDLGDGTLHAIWQRMAWAFNALIDGRMPERDWQGKACPDAGRLLASGWKFAPIQLRGDWEFFTKACGFPTATSVPNNCWQCNCSPHAGPLCWTDGSMEAGWRPTLRSHEMYVAGLAATGDPLPGLFLIRTMRIEGVMADVMHTMDIGVTCHVVANIMSELMDSRHFAGTTKDNRLQALAAHLDRYYKEVSEPHRIDGKLTYNRIHATGDWPKFKGKAAHTRKLARYAVRLATEANSGSEHDRLRQGVAQTLSRMYDVFESEPRFLSTTAKTELAELSHLFMVMYSRLADEALANDVRYWKMIPKFHLLQHILEHQCWVNPRTSWAYADEDLQRLLKGIATSCHSLNVPHMVLHKWLCTVFSRCRSVNVCSYFAFSSNTNAQLQKTQHHITTPHTMASS